jgi:ABC-2 type transport system ATP-binding protein
MFAITTRDLNRKFGRIQAVDHLDMRIPIGSLFGLIGPNGAGKTTTIRMLAGLLEPTSGEIRINELPMQHYWQEIQWQVGFMPDFYGVYDELLVWEYLDFFARCYRLEGNRRKKIIDELLELVDLTEKRESYIHTLSRGMRQRLCLAHVLIHDPQILLLDEPASGLDPRARVEMRELLRELRSMGKTILLSSHILPELAELCDQVAIMERGRLVAHGSIREILKDGAGPRFWKIQVLNDPERATTLLATSPMVVSITKTQSNNGVTHFEIELKGGDADAADLLASLITEKIRVAAFSESVSDLEDAFLSLTKGEVS